MKKIKRKGWKNMKKQELSEIKRCFKKDSATFTRVAGCYVNSQKEKVTTFEKPYLPDEEFYKYLEITKKVLSGMVENKLNEVELLDTFYEKVIMSYDEQKRMLTLKSSALKDAALLDTFYDKVITGYEHPGNYLILLYHDCYDVPIIGKDKTKLDESEDVFEYILCAICPVELSKPALGYKAAEKDIGERDWVVGMPESGFIYPSFMDRGSTIDSVLTYTKNAKKVHRELWKNVLGCNVSSKDLH